MLPFQGAEVRSLVGELRSHMPHGVAKTLFFFNLKNKKRTPFRNKQVKKQVIKNRTVLWTLLERERVGRFGRMALKHV